MKWSLVQGIIALYVVSLLLRYSADIYYSVSKEKLFDIANRTFF